MNRRSMLGTLAGFLAAPFALKAKAAVMPLTPYSAEIYDGDSILCHYARPDGDDRHQRELIGCYGKVNAIAFEANVIGLDRPVSFPPGTLMMSNACRFMEDGGPVASFGVEFTYKASEFNNALHPSGDYRRLSPAPYATSDFAAFRNAAGRGVAFGQLRKRFTSARMVSGR